MSIRNTTINTNGADNVRSGYIQNAGRTDRQQSPEKAAGKGSAAGRDSVEISDAGRAAASDLQAQELRVARAALHGAESLSPEREATIRERIDGGFYQKPEVAAQIAAAVAKDMMNDPNV